MSQTLATNVHDMIQKHLALASQYESVGDSSSAARLRQVANLLSGLFYGDVHTILPSLTPGNMETLREKEKEVEDTLASFYQSNALSFSMDKWEEEAAYDEYARRVVDMVVHAPSAAPIGYVLSGIDHAVSFLISSRSAKQEKK